MVSSTCSFFFLSFSGGDNFFRMRTCTLQKIDSKSTGGLETLQQAAVLNSKLCKIHKFTLKTALKEEICKYY